MPVVLELMGLMLEPHLLLAAAGPPRGGAGGGAVDQRCADHPWNTSATCWRCKEKPAPRG